ncbi:MAG: DNA polymerase Y family protein [Brevundimonas sp.]|nr:DNA polymerase Y family protein [Brevundimonas sp.]
MRRIVSVWLIDWPISVRRRSLERARRPASPPEPALDPRNPFALILKNNRGAAVIHALNPAARAAGLRRGQTQADARAMIPHLLCQPADPAADARALKALAHWAERWSPSVSVDPSDEGLEGLFLDITGAAHLFGGETALLRQIRQRLAEAGMNARVALAPTPGAAWALARWGDGEAPIAKEDDVRDRLAPLPVEALRIQDRTLAQARRFGLKRIGDLYPMPRAGLARRFRNDGGVALVQRLDQALGPRRRGPRPRPPAAPLPGVGDLDGAGRRSGRRRGPAARTGRRSRRPAGARRPGRPGPDPDRLPLRRPDHFALRPHGPSRPRRHDLAAPVPRGRPRPAGTGLRPRRPDADRRRGRADGRRPDGAGEWGPRRNRPKASPPSSTG